MPDRLAQPVPPPLIAQRPRARRVASLLRTHGVLVVLQVAVGLELVTLAVTADVSTMGRLIGVGLALLTTGGLLAMTIHERPAVRGLAALIAGVLGVSAGAGIAPVYLATAGFSLIVVIAAASMIAGLVLLVVGAWMLIRATPGWWRLLAIPVAFLVLQFLVLPLGGAVYGTHPPQTPTSGRPPSGAESVSFATPDGVTLVGWYTSSRNGAAVIVLPGSGGDKDSTRVHADVLVGHGYGVLALDSRGTGDSGGVGNAWGWHGPADIAGALTWLSGRPEVDAGRVAVLGLSMGGEEAITAAATDPRIAAVVAEGVSARIPEDLAYLPWEGTGIIERIEAWVMYGVADWMTDAQRPEPLVDAVAAASRVPLLLIVGNDPAEAAAAPLFARAAPTVDIWTLPDAPHIQSLALHPADWEARVVGFLDVAVARP
jgi:dienelactone hydrolase